LGVLIESVPCVDAGCRERTQDRARQLGSRSLYVLAGKEDADVHVEVSEDLRRQGFQAEELRRLLAERFRAGDYDAGLREGVGLVSRFEQDRKKTAP